MATNNLKLVIGNEGITQTALAEASGIGSGTISKVCGKKTNPAPTTKQALVGALNGLAKNHYTVEDIFP